LTCRRIGPSFLIANPHLPDDAAVLLRADAGHRGQAHGDGALRAVLDRPKVLAGNKKAETNKR